LTPDAIISAAADIGGATKPSPLRVHALINLNAGTALDLDQEEIRQIVTTAFAKQGHRISIEFLPPNKIEEAIARAAASDVDALIVGGGDGTIRTAARFLMGTEKALGILPLGTMNRMAKDLDIPLDLAEAAAFLATASPIKIDVGTINDGIFLCNSVMGVPLGYSVGRARLRGRPATTRLPRYLAIIREVLSSRRKLSVFIDSGSEQIRVRALSIVVTNNGYDEDTPWLRRTNLDGGKLTMYISSHRSGLGLAKALFWALLGRWSDDPDVTELAGSQFVIHSPKRRKRLANDGEVVKLPPPLRYGVSPRALTVLAKGYEEPRPYEDSGVR
jgi:diacylglycerol kinase family enzyme